jgi:putative ABC transport system permease protein
VNVITRGIRNAFRNGIRTFSIIIILSLSVGLSLAMLVARQAVNTKIQSVKASVGNTVMISPAGAQGFEGGGEPLTTDALNKVVNISHVATVVETLSDRLTTDNTNLKSAIEPGSLGQRAATNSGVGFQAVPEGGPPGGGTVMIEGNGQGTFTRTFTPPVLISGVNNVNEPTVFGGSSVSFIRGQAFDPTKDEAVAVVGSSLATKNNLSVGSTFTAYNTTVKVVGIYDAGTMFANNGVVMPLSTVQRLSNQAGKVTAATVTVDSLDNIGSVVSQIKSTLGSAADITNNQESAKQTIAPLENVKTIALYSLIGALIAGAIIIFMTMMMIVRERRREIGVMKAIGASNVKTVLQFVCEAITLTILAMIIGLIIGATAANPITKVLVNNSTSNTQTIQPPPGGPVMRVGGGFSGRGFRNFGTSSVSNLKTIKTSVGWSLLGFGVATSLLIAIVGSALPAYFISKVRPADVMRAE